MATEEKKVRKPRKPQVRRPNVITGEYIIKLIEANAETIKYNGLTEIIEVCKVQAAETKKARIDELKQAKVNIENQLKALEEK